MPYYYYLQINDGFNDLYSGNKNVAKQIIPEY